MSRRRVDAVIDTTLFISALISARGAPGALYAAWRDGAFILHISDEQRAEIADVLSRPKFTERFRLSTAAVQGLLYLQRGRGAHCQQAPFSNHRPVTRYPCAPWASGQGSGPSLPLRSRVSSSWCIVAPG
jgi:hypothetical protein